MIVCKLELWRGGNPDDVQTLGMIEIGNKVGRTLETGGKRGDYSWNLYKKRENRVVHQGTVRDFPRLSYHPWNLVREILNAAAEENGGRV